MNGKKGSMELGVNAIVILIIALAILGLAIAFVTNLFRSGGNQLGDIISRSNLPVHADSVNPIKFERDDIQLKLGEKKNVLASVYDNEFFDPSHQVSLHLKTCVASNGDMYEYGDDAAASYNPINMIATGQTLTPGTDGGYKVLFTSNPDFTSSTGSAYDTYVCTIEAGAYDPGYYLGSDAGLPATSTQLIITVTP